MNLELTSEGRTCDDGPTDANATSSQEPGASGDSNIEMETLDRANVLELEAFIEREQWIQEQIKVSPQVLFILP